MPRNFTRYTGYEIAQMAEELYEKEGITPEEFLDLVYPEHRVKDAVGYLRRLASGKQKVDPIHKASQRDSGRTMTVWYRVDTRVDKSTGEIIDDIRTAKVNVPFGYSRLDMASDGGTRLREAADAYFKKTFARRKAARKRYLRDRDEPEEDEEEGEEERYLPIRTLSPQAKLHGFDKTVHSGAPVVFK